MTGLQYVLSILSIIVSIVIIILVVIGSPVIKKWFAKTMARIKNKKSQVPMKGAQ